MTTTSVADSAMESVRAWVDVMGSHFETLPTESLASDGRDVAGLIETLDRTDIPAVPDKAYEMRHLLRASGWQQVDGYRGGGEWRNLPGRKKDAARLPAYRGDGTPITYTEFDVDPFTHPSKRGLERIVRSSDHRTWYTDDHYKTFVEVK